MRRTPARRLLALLLAAAVPAAAGQLVVFVDGRVLPVVEARLEGGRVVLELPGGGTMEVPALRVDRVIADATPEPEPRPLPEPACEPWWAPEPLPGRLPFRREIERAARHAGIHPWLLAAVVEAESGFDPGARSPAGAAGLAQLMPSAAAEHGVRDVRDPAENLRGGAEHLRELLDRFGALPLALAAYNAGAATVERAGGVPPYRETRSFVRRVLARFCPGGTGGSP